MTKKNFVSIIAIVDRSGSMQSLVQETIIGFNTFLADQKKQPGEAIFTLATFADDYTLIHDGVALDQVPDLNTSTYVANGYTSLLDAIGKTVNVHGAKLAAMNEEDRPSKVLVLIMTDGGENSSREFRREAIHEIITHQRDVYSWEFVFIGANQDAVATGATMGVPQTHSYNYAATAVGTPAMFNSVSAGTSSYRSAVVGSSFTMPTPVAPNFPVSQGVSQKNVGVLGQGLGQYGTGIVVGQGAIALVPNQIVGIPVISGSVTEPLIPNTSKDSK